VIRALRSLLFSVIYPIYLLIVMGTVQEIVIRPLCALNPKHRNTILKSWLRCHANVVLGMARHLGGLRLQVQGALPETASVVVMNHQSLLDIPVAVLLTRGPCPIIPTRDKYTRGVATIARLARLCGFPSLSQGTHARREEHRAMVGAAEAVARGERTLIIYPEGHRSRDGEIQPFMASGLQLVFRHTQDRPVYIIVADGLWRLRSASDIALRIAGTLCTVQVLGPYTVPADSREHEAFIDALRAEMLTMLTRLRATGAETAPLASHPQPVG
jgi:1-acyl-sn-glycerol-3-phosphate acyltransferase